MQILHIYPTSRALRRVTQKYKEEDALLPALMRMDEFEKRAILIDNKRQIDPLQRILLLREAAKFEAFEEMKFDVSLLRFFTKSDALFKFFEELAAEGIDFEQLAQADAYAEFGKHLEILEKLLSNYHILLDKQAFTDKAFIPNSYRLNKDFLQRYGRIEIHLEGYLTHFELKLLEEIAQTNPLYIHYTTSPFNLKMQERFKEIGVSLSNDSHVYFSLSEKKVIDEVKNDASINAKVYAVEEREEQIAVAFKEIEQMVRVGIQPEEIVLILPDESFKEHFRLFDKHHNLNFAMGYNYSDGKVYKSLDALYRYWQQYDKESIKRLEAYGFDLEKIAKIKSNDIIKVSDFFSFLARLGLHECTLIEDEKTEKTDTLICENYLHFLKIFEEETLPWSVWLFLWLNVLGKITIDDVQGGKITVMGVLETRGVSFKGVVVVDFNEGIVPATSSKDQFLNSQVRTFANLPTKHDREALQKQYYKRLLEQAKYASILYCTSDNRLPSKFLYELGLARAEQTQAQFNLLYAETSQLQTKKDPLVEGFDASTIVWSASRLKTFLECKRKYYYRYMQNIKAKKEETLNEGAFLHTLLEHLYKEQDNYTSKKEMQKQIDMLLDKLLPLHDAQTNYKKLLWKEKLKGFIENQIRHFKSGWKVVEREKEFHGNIGGLRFKGRIDRIDQNPTNTLILDYKSGSTKEAQKTKNIETLNDLQMSIYDALLKERYSQFNLAFIKLFENGEMEEIYALEEKNKRLAEVIIMLKQTKNFVAQKTEILQKCKFCEFALLCERGIYL